VFSAELRDKAEGLVGRYPEGRSALLPLLHLVQAQDGYISDDGITECARLLALTKAEVMAVATFYSMYKRAPMGRHLVSVCTNFSCKVRGAQEVYDELSARLGVGHNQTTADGAITLEHAECLGNCEGAPVVTVDYFNYECLTPEEAVRLVGQLRNSAHAAASGSAPVAVPPPTRGYPSPGIRDVEYRLAGLGPRHATEPGVIPDQTTADDAAVPTPAAGPGAAAETVGTETPGGGGGAEERGPEGLEPESGAGKHDYGGASEQRDEPTQPPNPADAGDSDDRPVER
jgi:NADH-quinone oxidoreductase subunit E